MRQHGQQARAGDPPGRAADGGCIDSDLGLDLSDPKAIAASLRAQGVDCGDDAVQTVGKLPPPPRGRRWTPPCSRGPCRLHIPPRGSKDFPQCERPATPAPVLVSVICNM